MNRDQYEGLDNNQQSIFYYLDSIKQDAPLLNKRPNFQSYHYPYMLSDDIANGILPISWKGRNIKASLHPENKPLSDLISFGITARTSYHARRSLPDALHNFFQRVALKLALFGECPYEIVEMIDTNSNDVTAFFLSPIQPGTIISKQDGTFTQHIPKTIAAEREIECEISLSPERLLFFRFQDSIQDNWLKMMSELASLSEIVPSFWSENLGMDKVRVPFDSTLYYKLRDQSVALITSEIGWNMRKYPQDGMSEYYWLSRKIRFELFLVGLRESLLTTLNEGIGRIEKKISMRGDIVIEGFPTVEEILQAEEDLESGSCHAGEIMERFSPY